MGEIFANQPHPTSNFVKIVIPKMRLIDERSDIERDLEMEIQSKVIPMLSELSENHDLLPDIIEFLQHARTTNINIKNLEETILFLTNHPSQTTVEKVILRLYAEWHSNMEIFNRLNQEITENMVYQQSLYENVSSLSAKFDSLRNKSTPQHKKFFNLKNKLKDINKAVNDMNININLKK